MYLFNSDLLKRNSTLNVFTSVSLAVLLTGCGGESNSSGEQGIIAPPTESASISAQDIQDNSLVEQSFTIDLTEHVHTSNNQGFVLTNARSLSGDTCQVQGVNEDSFNVYSSDVNDCLYKYEVTTATGTSMATSYVRVAMGQNYASTTLPRITASTIESQVVVVDLESELGSSLPSDDFVLQDSVISLGSGTARVSGEHQIEFTPTAKGQTEVYYSYQNGESIQQGSLSIATSEDTYNTAPTAEDFAFSELALLGENIVVDVASYISDVDFDDVQLVGVQDFNSTTSLYDPTNTSNTKFEFSSTEPGPHDVAYTVSDHMGGYMTGVARIEVEPDFSLIQDWEDIVTHDPVISSDIRFFAPMTKVYADYVNASYTGTFVEDGSHGLKDSEIVTQTLIQAKQYCKVRGGRLPLQRELEALVVNETSAFTNHNWPTSKYFWTADHAAGNSSITVNLDNGRIENQPQTIGMYTTCVDFSNPKVSDFSTKLVNANQVFDNEYIYQLEVTDPDGNIAPFQDVYVEVQHNLGIFDNGSSSQKYQTDINGQFIVRYFDVSYNNSWIQVLVSSNNDVYPYIYEGTGELDVTDATHWESKDVFSYDKFASELGLPALIINNETDQSAPLHLYKEKGYRGEDFSAYFIIEAQQEVEYGRVSFWIQQASSTMDSPNWVDPDTVAKPIPMVSNVLGFVIDYNWNDAHDDGIYVYNGYENIIASQAFNVSYEENHVWLEKRDTQFLFFVSSNSNKPAEPVVTISDATFGNIDPSQDYWIGFGGGIWVSSSSYKTHVTSSIFNAYF